MRYPILIVFVLLTVLLAACSAPAANSVSVPNPTSPPASHEMNMPTPAQSSGSDAQPAPVPTLSTDGWLTYTSPHYGYKIRYPGDWKIDAKPVDSNQPDEQETVILSKPAADATGLAAQIMFHAARNDYMMKPPECVHRPDFKGVKACHDSLPKGQNPAQEILTFEKDGAFFTAQIAYEEPGSVQVYKAILGTFEFAR